jgi:hypothetical protein
MPLAPVEQQPVRRGPSAVPTVTPEQAYTLFRRGETPNALIVNGTLNLHGSAWLHTLPTWLRCTSLIVDDCVNLSVLPSDLHAERLSARRTPSLKEVDGRLSVRDTINLRGSGVQTIRADLHATRLNLAHCTSLRQLEGRVSVVHLDVRGCTSLQKLDDGVHVTQTLELAESGLTAVPSTLRAGLRWNDVPVDAKVAFTPELLSGRDIMNTSNVQRRRMLLERIGVQRFLADVGGLIMTATMTLAVNANWCVCPSTMTSRLWLSSSAALPPAGSMLFVFPRISAPAVKPWPGSLTSIQTPTNRYRKPDCWSLLNYHVTSQHARLFCF